MPRVQKMGGALAAIERGFQRAQIEEAAYQVALGVGSGERIVVGVNAFVAPDDEPYQSMNLDPGGEAAQVARLAALRQQRDGDEVTQALATVGSVAATTANVLPAIKIALAARATLGEVCGALRHVWGAYEPS